VGGSEAEYDEGNASNPYRQQTRPAVASAPIEDPGGYLRWVEPYDDTQHGPFATRDEAQQHADELNTQAGGAPFLVDAGEPERASYFVNQDEGNGWYVSMALIAEPTSGSGAGLAPPP
jgi:hypothetical protein